jgi:SAM-dependent methyltransferase
MKHLGGWIEGGDPWTHMPDIWGYLVLKYNISSVLDIGCGTGYNLKWFRDFRKAHVMGVEGDTNALEKLFIPKENIAVWDYSTGPFETKIKYDLCICTEFAEHVEAQYENNWLHTMKKCRYILFSHAVPGQGGYHHVNEQNKDYWIKRFNKIGMKEDVKETELFVKSNEIIKAPWCRGTLIFLHNENF